MSSWDGAAIGARDAGILWFHPGLEQAMALEVAAPRPPVADAWDSQRGALRAWDAQPFQMRALLSALYGANVVA